MNKYIEALKDVASMNYRLKLETGVDAFIVGGAARDTDFKKPFKDIDVFVVMDTDNAETIGRVQRFFDDDRLEFIDEVNPDNPYEENLNNIHSVEDYVLERYETRFPVQIVFQKSQGTGNPLKEVMDNFDLGICQAAFKYYGNDQYKMVKSEQYKQDKADSRVRLTPFGLNLNTFERKQKTRQRAARIANKLNSRIQLDWPEDIRAREQEQVNFQRALQMQQAAVQAQMNIPLAPGRVMYVDQINDLRPYWQAFNNL